MTRGWSIIQCSQMICYNQKNKLKKTTTTYHLPVCFCNVHVCPVSGPLSAVTSINTGAANIATLTHTDRGLLH